MGSIAKTLNPINEISEAVAAPFEMFSSLRNQHLQKEANKRNMEQNELNRQFNAQESQKQRDFEAKQAQIANQFASDEALKAFQRQTKFATDMWQKQNEYNSPTSQIGRLLEAGLNPNLFSGDNTAGSVGSVSSSPASPSMPHGSSASAPSSIPYSPVTVSNPMLANASLRVANAQARQAEANADRMEKLLPGELKIQGMTVNLGEADIELKRSQKAEIKSKMDVNSATLRNLDEKTNNLIREGRLLELDEKQRQIFLKEYEQRLTTELLQMKSKLRLDEANIKHIASQIALNASQQALNYANADYASAQTVNAYDVHLMNGIELQYKGKMMKLQYEKDNNNYQLSLLEGAKETRLSKFRANDSNELYRFVNGALDDVEIITRMAGNIFGQMPDYIKKK